MTNKTPPALALAARRLQRGPVPRKAGVPPLLLMTDSDRLPDPEQAVARLPRGIRARFNQRFKAGVVVRARDRIACEKLARRLAPLCRRCGIALIIANDIHLALRLGADGVHLAEKTALRGFMVRALMRSRRRRWRRHLIVTVSAHSESALYRALAQEIDGVLIAPVFATKSHPDGASLGTIRFATLVNKVRRRHERTAIVALGGVTNVNANRLIAAGASGFAAIEALS